MGVHNGLGFVQRPQVLGAGARAGGGLDTLCQLQPEGWLLFQGQVSPLGPRSSPLWSWALGVGTQPGIKVKGHHEGCTLPPEFFPVLLFPPAPSSGPQQTSASCGRKICFSALMVLGLSVTDASSCGALPHTSLQKCPVTLT